MLESITTWLFAVPFILFILYLMGRLLGIAIAKSFYEEKERRNEKEDN